MGDNSGGPHADECTKNVKQDEDEFFSSKYCWEEDRKKPNNFHVKFIGFN